MIGQAHTKRSRRQSMTDRPTCVPQDLYPFDDHYVDVDGATIHYVDEGNGPPLLFLHGNPTWSFLYRDVINGVSDRYRCIATDHPGFGLSRPPARYGFTPAEHARVFQRFVEQLDLNDVTMMVKDWDGPIGFAVATRRPQRFSAFVIGNTWAWPKADPGTQIFSRLLGGPVGGHLIKRRKVFVEKIVPSNVKRAQALFGGDGRVPRSVPDAGVTHATARLATRDPRQQAVPRRDRARPTQAQRPASADRVADEGLAFREPERKRWEELFPNHRTVTLQGAGHYIQEDAADEIVNAIRAWDPGIR
jgi:haloalkane dehalogenase